MEKEKLYHIALDDYEHGGRVSYLVPVKEIKEAEKPPHCCGGFSVLVTIV